MNRQNNTQEVIVAGIHLELTPSLKTFVQEKSERLFRHQEKIIRVRVELECDAKQAVSHRFTAKGHIQIYGHEMNATFSADECHKAVAMLIDKLDRMLERRSHMVKAKRQHVRVTDLEGAIPEVI